MSRQVPEGASELLLQTLNMACLGASVLATLSANATWAIVCLHCTIYALRKHSNGRRPNHWKVSALQPPCLETLRIPRKSPLPKIRRSTEASKPAMGRAGEVSELPRAERPELQAWRPGRGAARRSRDSAVGSVVFREDTIGVENLGRLRLWIFLHIVATGCMHFPLRISSTS